MYLEDDEEEESGVREIKNTKKVKIDINIYLYKIFKYYNTNIKLELICL